MKLEDFIKKIEESKEILKAQCKRMGLVHETFGNQEVRNITDIYYANFFANPGRDQVKASNLLIQFENWCMNYEGEM